MASLGHNELNAFVGILSLVVKRGPLQTNFALAALIDKVALLTEQLHSIFSLPVTAHFVIYSGVRIQNNFPAAQHIDCWNAYINTFRLEQNGRQFAHGNCKLVFELNFLNFKWDFIETCSCGCNYHSALAELMTLHWDDKHNYASRIFVIMWQG